MKQLSNAVPAIRAEDNRASQLVRLHALALQATRDREGLPVAYEKLVDSDVPLSLYGGWFPDAEHRKLVRPMTVSERGMIEARAAALELALEPYEEADKVKVDENVSAMFAGFRSMARQSGAQVDATVEVTMAMLAAYPLWAIAKGCMKIARDEAGLKKEYAPNDSEIAAVVKEILRPYRSAFNGVTALLAAKIGKEAAIPPMKNEDRPTFEELQARCAKVGIAIGARHRTHETTAAAKADFCKRYGITMDQLDAIPDAEMKL